MQAEALTLSERDQRNNIIRLTLAQALAGANAVVIFAVGAIIGYTLAPDKSLATLPISLFVVGMALWILPNGQIARHHGRRASFLVGNALGVLAGLLAAAAVMRQSFWLFCVATLCGGAYGAVLMSLRFAAADGVEAANRPRALSFVMGGGVVAGIVGPQLVTLTADWLPPHTYVATFLAQAGVAALSAVVLWGVKLPMPSAEAVARGRPLGEVARQPRFITAVVCGAVSYALMNFLMTAAPLAMHLCGHSKADSSLGLQWHVIAMYAPSFFTGRLISRFGAQPVVFAGLVLIGLSAVAGLLGADVPHFWASLVLLGLGWNFSFVGASTLVLECHRPEERTSVQSLNDFLVYGTMTIGSFISGSLLATYDWNTVLWVSFGPLAVAVLALVWTPRERNAVAGA